MQKPGGSELASMVQQLDDKVARLAAGLHGYRVMCVFWRFGVHELSALGFFRVRTVMSMFCWRCLVNTMRQAMRVVVILR